MPCLAVCWPYPPASPNGAAWSTKESRLGEGNRPRLVQQKRPAHGSHRFHALADPVRERLTARPPRCRAWCTELVRRMGVPELAALFDQLTLELTPLLQRAVAILREARDRASALMVDEPTADLGLTPMCCWNCCA